MGPAAALPIPQPPVSVSEGSSAVSEDWEHHFEALADAVVHTPEFKAACAAEEVRVKSPAATPDRLRNSSSSNRALVLAAVALATPTPNDQSAAVVETPNDQSAAVVKRAAAGLATTRGLDELALVVEQLLRDGACPWCAAAPPAKLVAPPPPRDAPTPLNQRGPQSLGAALPPFL
jgi:hypothetical protein